VDVPEISAVINRYAAAVLTGDRATLDALLGTDYEFISAHAQVIERERRLTTLAASSAILADLTFSNLDVRVVDSVAVVRADFSAEFRPHTGRTDPDRGVSTLVLSRDGDNWRLRHQHNSHVC
jgi:ketosteroid isomerase-like protein